MFSDNDLTEAVAAGVIPADAAHALRARVAERRHLPRVDEEHYRILDGGNDGFVALAAVLLMAGFGNIGWVSSHIMAGVLVAASAWGLAEYFVRVRRQTLTGIILSIAFFGGVVATMIIALLEGQPNWGMNGFAGAGAAIFPIASGATWLFWRRFAVPFAMGLVALGAVFAVMAGAISVMAGANPFGILSVIYPIMLLCGLGTFAFAMRWDLSDRDRVTDRHEVGFWVHSVAGGFVVQAVLYLVGASGSPYSPMMPMSPWALLTATSAGSATTILVMVALFTVVGLAIDRRSLIHASIGALLFALVGLFARGGAYATAFGWAALVTGGGLLALSVWWQAARRAIVPMLGGLADRLPPVARDEGVDPSIYD